MKKIKLLIKLFIPIFILTTITGCLNKKAITYNEFKNKMESMNYIVQDVKDQFYNYDYINQAYIAINKENTYQIEFYELSNNNYSTSFFNKNKSIFKKSKSAISIETSVDLGNNSKYVLETDGKYKVISRIDNTVVYLDVDDKYKSTVNDLLKKLGY